MSIFVNEPRVEYRTISKISGVDLRALFVQQKGAERGTDGLNKKRRDRRQRPLSLTGLSFVITSHRFRDKDNSRNGTVELSLNNKSREAGEGDYCPRSSPTLQRFYLTKLLDRMNSLWYQTNWINSAHLYYGYIRTGLTINASY